MHNYNFIVLYQSFNSVDHLSCLLCFAENSPPAHAVAKPFFGYLDTESVILLLILAA